eukprot:1772634-Pleurochrysis_carterae.AAC.1
MTRADTVDISRLALGGRHAKAAATVANNPNELAPRLTRAHRHASQALPDKIVGPRARLGAAARAHRRRADALCRLLMRAQLRQGADEMHAAAMALRREEAHPALNASAEEVGRNAHG